MLRSAVHLELLQHLASETALRQHSPHRFLNHGLGFLGTDESSCPRLQSTRITSVPAVQLVLFLVAGEDDLLRVHDDHVIAGVEKWGVGGFVLTSDDSGDLGGQPAENLTLGIDDEPPSLNITFFGEVCAHRNPVKSTT